MPFDLRTLCAAAALAAFTSAVGEGQAATTKSAPVGKFSGVDEIVFDCTSSTTFVNIPGLSRTFGHGAGAAEEVVVMLQGAFSWNSVSPNDTAYVRLLIDNQVQGPGDQVPLKSVDGFGSGTHGFNWQSKALTPGTHSVRVQWRSDLGSQLCVDARSLIVLHK
jgi:hypothetical protein